MILLASKSSSVVSGAAEKPSSVSIGQSIPAGMYLRQKSWRPYGITGRNSTTDRSAVPSLRAWGRAEADNTFVYILGGYYDRKRQRDIPIFWGAYSDEMEADSIGRKHILTQPNGWYEIKYSKYGTRSQARGEVLSDDIMQGNSDLQDISTRFGARSPEWK